MAPRRRPPDTLNALKVSDAPRYDLLERLDDATLRRIAQDETFGCAVFDAIAELNARGVDPFKAPVGVAREA
jgi:hypothetical protein